MKKKLETINYESSMILHSTYDFNLKILTVCFNSGVEYAYTDVALEDYLEFSNSESVGKSFNTVIKSKYSVFSIAEDGS
jgi:hypothetical protein